MSGRDLFVSWLYNSEYGFGDEVCITALEMYDQGRAVEDIKMILIENYEVVNSRCVVTGVLRF